jgi:spoIIIJ-associated protein
MRYIEEEGKTVEEALEKALRKAGIERSEARFEIINEGFSGEPARIRLYLENEDFDIIEGVIKEFFDKLGVKVEVEIEPRKRRKYYVNIHTRGYDSVFIGKRGKNLNALDHLINLLVKRRNNGLIVDLDVSGYKKRHKEFLINKAKAIARRVKETGMEMRFDPLEPDERKLVRDILRRDKKIRVYQVGRGDNVVLVIAPRKG